MRLDRLANKSTGYEPLADSLHESYEVGETGL